MAGRIVRFVTLALNYQDVGAQAGLARTNTQVEQVKRGFMGVGSSARNAQFSIMTMGFIAGAALRGLVKDAAEFEKEALLASFATGRFAENVEQMEASSRRLSQRMRVMPTEAASLTKSIARFGITTERFGVKRSEQMIETLARTSTAFSKLTEVAVDDVSKGLFRMGLFVTDTDERLGDFILTADKAASAMIRVGNMTAAGAGELLTFMRRFQSVAQLVDITPAELVGLGGAFANIDPTKPERVTTSVLRLFSTEFNENQQAIAQFMGKSREEFTKLRVNDPIGMFQELTGALREASDEIKAGERDLESLGGVITSLGITNFRDLRTVATVMASFELMPRLVRAANEEFGDAGEITGQYSEFLESLSSRLDGLGSAFGRARLSIVEGLGPAVAMLIGGLTELFELIDRNRVLAAGIGAVGAVGIFRLIGQLMRWVGPMFLLSGGGGPGRAIGGAGLGRMGALGLRDGLPEGGFVRGTIMGRGVPTGATLPGGGFMRGQGSPRFLPGSLAQRRGAALGGVHAIDAAFLAAAASGRGRMGTGRSGGFLGRRLAAAGVGGTAASLPRVLSREAARARRPSAGLFGRAGAAGLGAIFGQRARGFVTRRAAGGIAGRLALGAAGGGAIGLALSVMPMLGDLAGRLGDLADKGGEAGGAMGLLLTALGTVLKVVELVGNGVGFLFDKAMAFFAWIGSLPIVGDIIGGATSGLGSLNEQLDKLNNSLDENTKSRRSETKLSVTGDVKGADVEIKEERDRRPPGGFGGPLVFG